MSEHVLHVTPQNFKLEVLDSSLPVLVDFWAEWCGPCLALSPVIEEIAREQHGKVKVVKVDVQEHQELAAQFNIRNIPYMAFIKNGKKVADMVGNQPKQSILRTLETVLQS